MLPTFGQCIGTPGLPGCAAVLPTLSQCVASPVLQGCNVVLPTLAQCTASPSLAGCSVVLPPVAAIDSANAALLTTEMNALVSVNKQDEQKDDSVASVIEAVGDQRDVRKKTYCN